MLRALVLGAALGGTAVWLAQRGGRATSVPRPDFARVLPPGYLAQHVWRARLSGGNVPEAIVSSVRTTGGEYGYHPVDVQVLTWDAITHRWPSSLMRKRSGGRTIGEQRSCMTLLRTPTSRPSASAGR
jgi:hypothetical protein